MPQNDTIAERTDFEEGTIILECAVPTCKNKFPFTPGEQKFYSERGLFPPKRCPVCRAKRKQEIKNGGIPTTLQGKGGL